MRDETSSTLKTRPSAPGCASASAAPTHAQRRRRRVERLRRRDVLAAAPSRESAVGPNSRGCEYGDISRYPGPGACPDSAAISHACFGSASHRRTTRAAPPPPTALPEAKPSEADAPPCRCHIGSSTAGMCSSRRGANPSPRRALYGSLLRGMNEWFVFAGGLNADSTASSPGRSDFASVRPCSSSRARARSASSSRGMGVCLRSRNSALSPTVGQQINASCGAAPTPPRSPEGGMTGP